MSLILEDMVFGDYYKVFLEGTDERQYTIIRYDDIAKNGEDRDRIKGPLVSNMDSNAGEFYYKKDGALYITGRKTVNASAEEVAWIKACIAEDKFVDKQLTGLIPGILDYIDPRSLTHKDIKEDGYYRVDWEDKGYVIMRCESQDDPYRWTGPTLNFDSPDDMEPEFEDGSEDSHGAYFGGEDKNSEIVKIKHATKEEMAWLNECINAGELVDKPKKDEVIGIPTVYPGNVSPEMLIAQIKQLIKPLKQGKMDKYITELTPDVVGRHVKCRIDGKKISEALICAEGGECYLCQDVVNNTTACENRRGYKHACGCGNGTADMLQIAGVSSIEFIEKVGKFKVGDYVLIDKEGDGTDWVSQMDKYVGRIALITREKDPGMFIITVDDGQWNWHEKNFKESGTVTTTSKEMVKGDVYVYTGSGGKKDHVFRSENTGSSDCRCDRYMTTVEKYFSGSGGGLGSSAFRTATPKEKIHLLACIEAKKYVDPPKEEEMKQSIEIDPQVLIEMILNNQ